MAKKQFEAESKRLLDLMINSIYTHKEIFLREIISNASDAIDKLCYVALTDDKVGMNRSDFAITVSVDKENRTLTVSDNGIGMSREELENNLGVIASSGSYKFRQETEEKDKKDADIDIIGQFGVGFYSAFMVADSITVRRARAWDSCPTAAILPFSMATSAANAARPVPSMTVPPRKSVSNMGKTSIILYYPRCSGSVTVKRVALSSLAAVMVPLCRAVIWRAMASPSPNPAAPVRASSTR